MPIGIVCSWEFFVFKLFALFQGCDCNGHAKTCDVETGTCECLTRWVTGEHCER